MGITAVILLTFFVNAGFGRHIYCLSPSALPLVFKYSILAQIFNIAGIGLVKISVCLHILRIVDRAHLYKSIHTRNASQVISRTLQDTLDSASMLSRT